MAAGEPQYVKIYCAERAAHDAQYAPANRSTLGLCYAHKTDRWRCCCCGKPVSVVW